jgi:hypothetical protein
VKTKIKRRRIKNRNEIGNESKWIRKTKWEKKKVGKKRKDKTTERLWISDKKGRSRVNE